MEVRRPCSGALAAQVPSNQRRCGGCSGTERDSGGAIRQLGAGCRASHHGCPRPFLQVGTVTKFGYLYIRPKPWYISCDSQRLDPGRFSPQEMEAFDDVFGRMCI